MTIVENMIKRSKAAARSNLGKPAAKEHSDEVHRAGSELQGRGARLAIDIASLRAMNLSPAPEHHRKHLDEFRAVKRPLVKNIRSARPTNEDAEANERIILVSSALPGDGKTYVSVNLAMSLASEQDFDVLLIDGDAPRRQLTRLLAGGDTPGLLDILRGQVSDPLDVISSTGIENLHFMPAGTEPQSATELYGSDAMRQFLAKLSAQYPFFGPLVGSGQPGCDPVLPVPAAGLDVGDVRATPDAPVLVVGTTKDPATPYAGALDLQSRIAGSGLLTYESTEHAAYGRGVACIDDTVDRYLLTRKLPRSGIRCKA